MRGIRPVAFGAVLVVAAVVLAGCGGGASSGGGGYHSAQGPTVGAMPLGSALLGLRGGDRVSAQGRTLTAFSVKGTTFALDAPLVLYPNALVQGVAWIPTPPTSQVSVLLGTNDSEAKVMRYYQAAWKGLKVVQPKPRASFLYGQTAPNVLQRSLAVKTGKDYAPSVEIQRGPAIQTMDEHQYAQFTVGNAKLPLQPGGAIVTEIVLTAPVG
jgi:hypothetical protein